MGFKTLTIKEEVYKELLNAKRKEESFSEFFDRMIKTKKPDITRFYGAWKMNEDEWKRIKKKLEERRKSADKNFEERMKRLFE